jgi:hypothetical protein
MLCDRESFCRSADECSRSSVASRPNNWLKNGDTMFLRLSIHAVWMVAAAFCPAVSADAQSPINVQDSSSTTTAIVRRQSPVMDGNGLILPPWKEARVCRERDAVCVNMIVNSETGEVARVGERWKTGFAKVGVEGAVGRVVDASIAGASNQN